MASLPTRRTTVGSCSTDGRFAVVPATAGSGAHGACALEERRGHRLGFLRPGLSRPQLRHGGAACCEGGTRRVGGYGTWRWRAWRRRPRRRRRRSGQRRRSRGAVGTGSGSPEPVTTPQHRTIRWHTAKRGGDGGDGGGGGRSQRRRGRTVVYFPRVRPRGSLSSQLSRFGPLPEPLVALYTRQLLLGLAYLHAQRTVHRDVKGANLLLEKTGVLKLADFGMAKQLMEQVSFTRSFKGSAYWMAPEVIKQQGYGVQADIWSVGCTVLEMATGKPPWSQCTSQVQAIFKIASSPDLPAIPEHLSPQASEFILLCLQRDPAARPTAEELLRHPFVTGPLAANPLPPALADPLAALYDASSALRAMPSVAVAVGGGIRASGSMTLLGPGAAAATAAAGPGLSAGTTLAMAMNLTPLRLGPMGQTGSVAAATSRVGSVATTPAAASGAWTPFGGLMLNPAAAAAAAAAAAVATAGTTPTVAAAAAAAPGGNPYALGLQAQYSAAAGGTGSSSELLGAAAGGAMSEDHLAALVLGNSVHISKAARVAQVIAADEERDGEDDTHIDFTTQPQLFRVRGLLTLPPLKMLHAHQLPPLTVQTQIVSQETYGGVGSSGAGDVGRA
ncbi:hypothetical protein Vretifemale_19716 [Volvox reticuliferus]|nr:hypothetical protein Vretifemale_19716 [Volvox reticuliferus]